VSYARSTWFHKRELTIETKWPFPDVYYLPKTEAMARQRKRLIWQMSTHIVSFFLFLIAFIIVVAVLDVRHPFARPTLVGVLTILPY
jgi:hypothetical protein